MSTDGTAKGWVGDPTEEGLDSGGGMGNLEKGVEVPGGWVGALGRWMRSPGGGVGPLDGEVGAPGD